ncbi:SdrD B-like domain-containing protein, partial [Spirosoma sp. 48-14]
MPTFTTKSTSWLLLFFIISIAIAIPGSSQTITGTVFRDFNSNGTYEAAPVSGTYSYGEPGVGGVIVKAYNASGVVSASAISSTLTASLGSYTLSVGNTNAYRVEFTNLSAGDFDGFRGTNNATSVQFVNGGSTSVNFGLNYPSDYCQSNPQIVVPCYVNGNSTGTGLGTTVAANRDVLVQLPYNSTGDSPAESSLGLNKEIGTLYGVAYQRQGKHLFTSAFLKRHSGLGPGGPGAIYLSDLAGNHSVFITLPSAATAITAAGSTTVLSNTDRALSNLAATPNYDPSVFDQVGKAGLGDLEVSDDGTELYVVNLGDRKLYRIPINNPTSLTPTAGTPTSYTIPAPSLRTGSQFRPFGLKYYRDRVYVGGVTTNEAVSTTISFGLGSTDNSIPLQTRDTTGMKAVVYEFNPVNGSFTTVLTFPLTYKKGATNNDKDGSSRAEYWFPWVDTQAPNSFLSRYARNDLPNASHPQPMLTDIEIDVDGAMIIALRDRFGEQYGNQNYGTNTTDNITLYRAIAPGDLLRAGKCNPSVNQWTIENNASICGGTATAGASTTQGIGGGEFYYGDAISQPNTVTPYHLEMVLGGLALLPGYGEVLSTVMDPTTHTDAGGIRRFRNNGFGDPSTSAQIFFSGNDVSTYGKGNGLGDVEVVCNPAPVQIGNRVWLDSNNNGIQDPGETPLAGVKVTLSGPGLASPVSVTTNSTGEYYFSNASGTNALGFVYSLTGITSGSSYTLTFPTSVSTASLSSKPNSATGTNPDYIDTDPNASGIVTFTLGQAGANNFTFDAGFVPCSFTALAQANGNLGSTTVCQGTSATLTAQVTPAGSYTYAWSAPTGVTVTNGTTATATTSGLPTGTHTFTLTVSSSPVCSTTATVTVVVSPTPTPTLTSATICVGQSTTLTATGGTSYTLSNGITSTTSATGSFTVTPTSSTTYTVTVANASGCISTTTAAVSVNQLPIATLSSATICVGQPVTLTATGGTSYTFSNGTTNTTGLMTATPASTTAYSVTVANASGCHSTTTATVNVNQLPSPTLTSATICAGQSTTLTATGGTSYTLSNGITSTTSATGFFTVTPAGSTTYTVTVANASGCISTTTATVSVNQLPIATLSSATICAGQPVTLTATGGTSYTFSNGTTNTTGLMTATPVSTTAYSVTVANASGCHSTTTATVNVNPLPTAALSSATICAGASATLTATGGTSYAFSNGTTNATGLLTVAPVSTTAYSVTVTDAAGCQAVATGGVTVNNNPVAALSSATLCVGQSVTLTASGGSSFVFSDGTANTTGLLIVAPTSTTAYSVTASSGANCSASASATVTVNLLPTPALTSATICAGESVTLTATGGTSYTFSNGTTNTTGLMTATPVSTTAYSVTVANATGCISSTTATITVNQLPALLTSVSCNGLATYQVSFTATPGASVTASLGTITGSTITDIPSGQPVLITLTLNGCSISQQLSQNCSSNAASLGDFVWVDANKNGVQDQNEAPIPGVTVILYTSGVASATTVTDASGLYSFTGLTPGNSTSYVVGFTPPAGYTATIPYSGTDRTKDSNADLITGRTESVTLTNGEYNSTLDAGFYLIPAGLGDFVWIDLNKNGLQDGIEPGIEGVIVTLYVNGATSSTTTTDASGLYSFTGLTPGNSFSYSVGFTAPTGYTITTPLSGTDRTKDSDADLITGLTQSVTLTPGEFNSTLDAGYLVPAQPAVTASLGDFVWHDLNKDGIQDVGEPPIAGVIVTLYTDGVISATTTTNASGLYSFTGLTPGNSFSYVVGFTQPSGYTASPAQQGGNDAKDSDANPITGFTRSVTLAAAENNLNLDAGFYTLPIRLTLDKVVNKSKAQLGEVLTYTIVLTNVGSTTATNVTVRDSTTSGLTYIAN